VSDPFKREEAGKFKRLESRMQRLRREQGLPPNMAGSLSFSMWRRVSPLRVEFASRGWSFEDAASHTGLDERTLRRVANGETMPTPSTLASIAKALDLGAPEFWDAHCTWASFRPSLDAYAIRTAARGARRYAHPVHRLMRERGWSRSELADEAGVGPTTIRKMWSNTDRPPSLKTLIGLSRALGVTIDWLVVRLEMWYEAFVGVSDADTVPAAVVLEEDYERMDADEQND